nr:transcription factor, K-box [Tanacetum cinerariifolium]
AKENLLENMVMEDLTSLEAENKTRTIINLKEKNERLLKKIQETNLKSHITDVTNLDTMLMNVQTNARINTAGSAEIAESAETAGSTETTGSAEITKSVETIVSEYRRQQGVQKIQKLINVREMQLKKERKYMMDEILAARMDRINNDSDAAEPQPPVMAIQITW